VDRRRISWPQNEEIVHHAGWGKVLTCGKVPPIHFYPAKLRAKHSGCRVQMAASTSRKLYCKLSRFGDGYIDARQGKREWYHWISMDFMESPYRPMKPQKHQPDPEPKGAACIADDEWPGVSLDMVQVSRHHAHQKDQPDHRRTLPGWALGRWCWRGSAGAYNMWLERLRLRAVSHWRWETDHLFGVRSPTLKSLTQKNGQEKRGKKNGCIPVSPGQ
jgi:hypothetical protein